jgi:hypothetical protein
MTPAKPKPLDQVRSYMRTFAPRHQTPFGHATAEGNCISRGRVSAGRELGAARPQTPHPRETQFRPQGRSQTEFGNEGKTMPPSLTPSNEAELRGQGRYQAGAW